ncbi:SfnB family sulfur acquisition oxidoreductase [Caballeronia sp. LZ008]|uniref:SfnB family sulfur acquisition oxidoreductase n=1 Tax=unclassified Caballeronia TaxID=2646786 RepID=UPI00202825A9|nr:MULTISPECIES: SfnB family sulfur acquisition oxidoreductase [unclassified Caballeronia]MDR5798369.1 SfnB family sulfur acquisition oxidoreductase [Caballeronia sp. LZ008]
MTQDKQLTRAALIRSDDEALDTARRLAAEFAVDAAARDRDRRLPLDEIEVFSASGLWGIGVPRAFGGIDVSVRTIAQVFDTISAADSSLGQIPQNHFATLERLRHDGTPSQQDFFFSRALAGERFGNATAEPGDRLPSEHETRVLRRANGNGFVLTGRKVYSTGALFAHWIPVAARDDDGLPVTAFVARHARGVEVIDDWSGFGQRTTASGQVRLDEVELDALQIVARGRRPNIDTANAVSQALHAAIDLGIGRAALDETKRFLHAFAHPARGSGASHATDDPYTLRDIGALTVDLHAAEALTARAAESIDRARDPNAPREAVAAAIVATAEAKIVTTRFALDASNKLFELAGTQSTRSEHNLDRHWRNARTHTLHDSVRWKYHAVGQYALNDLLCDPFTYANPYTKLDV